MRDVADEPDLDESDEGDDIAIDAANDAADGDDAEDTEASSGARRKAHLILEVLAGVRTPSSAAEELAIPLPRYYQWEDRGVAGLVAALEPRRRGPRRDPTKELESLAAELESSRKECARYEALLRSAQRTIGLASREDPEGERSAAGRKKKRPTVRALTAIRKLERGAEGRS
jgi:Helix-turn-helix domain